MKGQGPLIVHELIEIDIVNANINRAFSLTNVPYFQGFFYCVSDHSHDIFCKIKGKMNVLRVPLHFPALKFLCI